jgi:LCP family protein required for cell wall assembly
MGVDARPGEAIDIGVRPDSLMIVRLNPDTGSCHLLAIPRDTRTELPGYGLTKVNHALAVGGIPYQLQVVELLLGIEVDRYVLIDFTGFQQLVDAVGGVKITIAEGFTAANGTVFEPGELVLNGAQALAYSQWRGGPDGDFGRIQRQQQMLRALVAKAASLNIVRSIDELLPAVADHLRTDLSTTEMASIGTEYRDSCPENSIEMQRLEGYGATYDDPLLMLPLYYIVVDEAEIRRRVEELLAP